MIACRWMDFSVSRSLFMPRLTNKKTINRKRRKGNVIGTGIKDYLSELFIKHHFYEEAVNKDGER